MGGLGRESEKEVRRYFHTHTNTHTNTYTHIHTDTRTHVHMHICTRTKERTHTCTHAHRDAVVRHQAEEAMRRAVQAAEELELADATAAVPQEFVVGVSGEGRDGISNTSTTSATCITIASASSSSSSSSASTSNSTSTSTNSTTANITKISTSTNTSTPSRHGVAACGCSDGSVALYCVQTAREIARVKVGG